MSERVHALIRLVYECAIDPRQWPVFLAEYAKAVGAHASGLVVQDLSNNAGEVAAGYGFDPFWERRYAEYYAGVNVWTKRGEALFEPGKVVAGEAAVSEAELVKTEFYADFLRPQQHFYCFGGTITREASLTSYFTALRSRKAGPFSEEEHALTRQLMPHFESAVRVHQRIAGLEARVKQTSGALDSVSLGVIVTDGAGRVLFMNRWAEERLRRSGPAGANQYGLTIRQNVLSTQLPAEAARLRELIARTAETLAGNGLYAGGAMSVLGSGGKAPLRILAAPLADGFRGSAQRWGSIRPGHAGRRPAVVLFISSPGEASAPAAIRREQLLNLTPAEARLASALVEGKTVKEFAEEAGVSLNTARTHLKRVFHKTGVKRQAELMRVAMTAVCTASRPEE